MKRVSNTCYLTLQFSRSHVALNGQQLSPATTTMTVEMCVTSHQILAQSSCGIRLVLNQSVEAALCQEFPLRLVDINAIGTLLPEARNGGYQYH